MSCGRCDPQLIRVALNRARGGLRFRVFRFVFFGRQHLRAGLLQQIERGFAVATVVVFVVLEFVDDALQMFANPSDVAVAVVLTALPAR